MNVLHVPLLSEPSVKLLVTNQKHGMTIWMLWCLVSEQKKKKEKKEIKANDHWSTHPITWFLAERLVIHMKSQNTTWSFCLWQTTGKSYAKHHSKFLMHMQNSFNACYITTLKATILSDPGSEATAKEENATRTSPQNQYALQVHKPNHKQQQTQIQKLQLHQWLLPRL